MESSDYKMKRAMLGKDQAEKELDQMLKDDLDYMIEQNKKGSVKIQAMCIGDDEGCLAIPPEHRP